MPEWHTTGDPIPVFWRHARFKRNRAPCDRIRCGWGGSRHPTILLSMVDPTWWMAIRGIPQNWSRCEFTGKMSISLFAVQVIPNAISFSTTFSHWFCNHCGTSFLIWGLHMFHQHLEPRSVTFVVLDDQPQICGSATTGQHRVRGYSAATLPSAYIVKKT